MLRLLTLLGLGAACALAPAALAQPDPTLDPTHGVLSVASGAEPATAEITLGSAATAAAPSEAGCPGAFAAAPDAHVNLETDGSTPLHLYVRSSTDTVLLARLPDGSWLCNDDGYNLDPDLVIDAPAAGTYTVWVGAYGEGSTGTATLYASELVEVEMMADADATDASVTLDSGFEPDPHQVNVTAGGADLVPYDGCNGYVDSTAPDATLDLDTDGSLPLYIYAEAEQGDDLTLTVVGPGGEVFCNDDAVDLSPGLVVEAPEGGRYAVWVGTFVSGSGESAADVAATLSFSETDGPTADSVEDFDVEDFDVDTSYGGGETLSLFAMPSHGTLTLEPGFTSQSIEVSAGGGDAMPVAGPGCAGVIDASAPTVNLVYGEGGTTLAFHVSSETDTTLLVSLPNGEWRCSDDEVDRNPAVVLDAPEAGLYNVWVGAYSQDGTDTSATLLVSESDPR